MGTAGQIAVVINSTAGSFQSQITTAFGGLGATVTRVMLATGGPGIQFSIVWNNYGDRYGFTAIDLTGLTGINGAGTPLSSNALVTTTRVRGLTQRHRAKHTSLIYINNVTVLC